MSSSEGEDEIEKKNVDCDLFVKLIYKNEVLLEKLKLTLVNIHQKAISC